MTTTNYRWHCHAVIFEKLVIIPGNEKETTTGVYLHCTVRYHFIYLNDFVRQVTELDKVET